MSDKKTMGLQAGVMAMVTARALELYGYNISPVAIVIETCDERPHPTYIAEKTDNWRGIMHYFGALDWERKQRLVQRALDVYGAEAAADVAFLRDGVLLRRESRDEPGSREIAERDARDYVNTSMIAEGVSGGHPRGFRMRVDSVGMEEVSQ